MALDEAVPPPIPEGRAAAAATKGLLSSLNDALLAGMPADRREAASYALIAGDLAAAGIATTVAELMGATRDEVLATATAFVSATGATAAAKEAVTKAALALVELKDSAAAAADRLAQEAAERRAADALVAQGLRDRIRETRLSLQPPGVARAERFADVARGLVAAGLGEFDALLAKAMGASRQEILDFLDSFVAIEANSLDARTAITDLGVTLLSLQDAAAAAAHALDVQIRAVAPKFMTPSERIAFERGGIANDLAALGINASQETLASLSKRQIADLVSEFVRFGGASDEVKAAVVGAAGALADLIDAASQIEAGGVRDDMAELARVFGDFGVLNPVKTISEQFVEGTQVLATLQRGLDGILGRIELSVQERLAALVETQRRVSEFRTGSLADGIEGALLRTLSPQGRIARLRDTEARLFGELNTADDPVAVAQRLQAVIIDRIKEEAALREDAHAEQRNAIEEQIAGLRNLRNFADDIAQFTSSLRSSDLSPLDFATQLSESRSLFETTLAAAQGGDQSAQGNLLQNARAYLDEARAYFASSADYAAIFTAVTASLDAVGVANVDPQVAALEAQLATLSSIDSTAAAELAGLHSIDAGLARRDNDLQAGIAEWTARAERQIAEQHATNAHLRAQLQQAADRHDELQRQLQRIEESLSTLADNSTLETNRGASRATR